MIAYISTGAFHEITLMEIVAFCLENGLTHVELSSKVSSTPDLLAPVYSTCRHQINYIIHNYFPPPQEPFVLNLAAANKTILQQSYDLCCRAIDLSVELGAPIYSVHSGYAFHLTPDMLGNPIIQSNLPESAYFSPEDAYQIFLENITGLSLYAKNKGIRLLLENNVVSPLYLSGSRENRGLLMADADSITRFMQDIADPNVSILLDLGHLNVTASALGFSRTKFIEQIAPYIGALHISDNDGIRDNNQPFTENSWFCPFLPDFNHIPMVIEVYNIQIQQIKQQYEVLEYILS